MRAVIKREFAALFSSFRTYLFLALMLGTCTGLVLWQSFTVGNPQFIENGNYLALALAVLVPLLTAPTYAGDRRQKTERLLFSLPIRPWALALARFVVCLMPVIVACALILLYPAALSYIGGVGMCASAGMAAALVCLGALLTAVSLLVSCLSPNTWVAYLVSVALFAGSYFMPLAVGHLLNAAALTTPVMLCLMVVLFLIFFALTDSVFIGVVCTAVVDVPIVIGRMTDGGAGVARTVGKVLEKLAVFSPIENYALGIVDVSALVYYLSATALVLCITALCVRAKRQATRRALA